MRGVSSYPGAIRLCGVNMAVDGLYRVKQQFHVRDYVKGESLAGIPRQEHSVSEDGVIVTLLDCEEGLVPKWYMERRDFLEMLEPCQRH